MNSFVAIHLTARVYRLPVLLTEHEVASWLWGRLCRGFSAALAAVIMPNHIHLVTAPENPGAALLRLGSIISGLRRSNNPAAPDAWEPAAPPELVPDAKHLRRLVRYLALNPCRARLVDDPLGWPWSTHRDVIGAIAEPWVDAARVAAALGLTARGFAQAHHAYVSAAGSVCVTGTPFPRPAAPSQIAARPLEALVAAAAAASRATPADVGRRSATRALFLQLAGRHGWRDAPRLAELCGASRRAIRWNLGRADGAGLDAAELCLGDERLRRWAAPRTARRA
ncbi:MAG: hypothetical protein HY744_26015 [Deltaproteobacteria bacterium]|nr:hypothetical protein [Deltaproteobacteria bacterium]